MITIHPEFATCTAVLTARNCDYDCEYLHRWQEPHPYGAGTAYETLMECECENDACCPVVQRSAATAAQEQAELDADVQP